MNRKELAKLLGITAGMVTRHAKRGMPTDDVAKAQRWRKRNLNPVMVKGQRAGSQAQLAGGKASLPSKSSEVRPVPGSADVCDLGPAASPLDQSAASGAGAALGTDAGQMLDDPQYLRSRSRQAAADARTAEIKLAELEGALVRIDQVMAALAARLAPVREGLMQIPARVAPLAAAQSDPARIQTMIEVEIHQVLAPLANVSAAGLSGNKAQG